MSYYDCKDCTNKIKAKIAKRPAPSCPYLATIPAIEVDRVSNLTGIANAFVHVTENNTTYYIDDQHRILLVWSGDVEYNNYDYVRNPLKLKSQRVIDFANSRIIEYDKTGTSYMVFNAANVGSTGA